MKLVEILARELKEWPEGAGDEITQSVVDTMIYSDDANERGHLGICLSRRHTEDCDYPSVTREPFKNRGRATDLMASGKLESDLGLPRLDPARDRIMICGSPALNKDMRELLNGRGFVEGTTTTPGDYVVERAFVDQ